jgi:predicted GTPase
LVPGATIIEAASRIRVDSEDIIKGKRVLVVEDGPTLTHGGMKFGAGTLAAQRYGATEIVDPRPFLVGELKDTFTKYPEIGLLLPAMGYGDQQLADLEATIACCDCDAVVIGTPIDLKRVINIDKPSTRVSYDLDEIGDHKLEDVLAGFLSSIRVPG